MRVLCVLALAFSCFLSAPKAARAQDESEKIKELQGFLDSIRVRNMSFMISMRKLETLKLKQEVGALRDAPKSLERIKGFPKILADEKIPKEERQLFLDRMEQGYTLILFGFLPKHYGKEVAPLLFNSLRSRPLPQKPTKIQERLIKTGKGSFEGIIFETAKMISEDRKVAEDKLNKALAEIAGLEKELQKLSKKTKQG